MDGHRITDAAIAKRFVLSGRALFTLKSARTGNHITFKIKAAREQRPQGPSHFVSVLDHADGQGGYSYLGLVRDERFEIGSLRKTHHTSSSTSAIALSWLFGNLAQGQLPEQCELWHEGKCGRCGRRLTHPDSIATGLGPECAGKK